MWLRSKGEGERERPDRSVPVRALVMSLLAFCVPVVAVSLRPDGYDEAGGLLLMLPALIPPFLLSYHKGWNGGSLALAAGMATLALVQVQAEVFGLEPPSASLTLVLVIALIGVCLGSGWLSELLLREREEAERLALLDPLTLLPNRRHLDDALHRAWARAIRGAPLSVVFFDLDRFKQINDHHGHAYGDTVLRCFGEVLRNRTRQMDISGRFGGEEFLSVLVDCDADGARQFADDVRRGFEAVELKHGPVTVSAGVASLDEGMASRDILVAAADQALYRAKAQGRNRVVLAPRTGSRSLGPDGSPPEAVDSSPDLADLRILVVDDDARMRNILSSTLEQLGCEVVRAASGLAAVDRLREDSEVDLMVTDVIMPGMSGFALADVVSRFRPALPVLYISGFPQSDVYWGGTPGMVRAFLEKPVDVHQLRATIERLITSDGAEGGGAREPGRVDAAASGGREAGRAKPQLSTTVSRGAPRSADARILLVDDEPATLRVLSRMLERAGFGAIESTTDPREAAARMAREQIDLLITDLHMPEMDGYELLREVATPDESSNFVPVLVLTGDGDPDARRKALSLGASDFLNKPFDDAEARARVRNLLHLRMYFRNLATERHRLEWLIRERTADLADSQTEIAHRLAMAAEYRDDTTGRHAARVGLLASHIASELGLSPREAELIRKAAPLHDVGKIGIPDAVLQKAGPLTEAEFSTIRAHTRIGGGILGRAQSELLRTACDIALRHHEHWDGTGYPDGIEGESIPLAARITAVADTFDVLTHQRPYKEAWTDEEACEEITRCSGSHFDPAVVEAFTQVWRKAGTRGVNRLSDPVTPEADTSSDSPAVTRRFRTRRARGDSSDQDQTEAVS